MNHPGNPTDPAQTTAGRRALAALAVCAIFAVVLSSSSGTAIAEPTSGDTSTVQTSDSPAAASEVTTAETAVDSVASVETTAPAAAPQLSIAVDNGHSSTTAGETLTYTITIQNLGSADVPGLLLTQSAPVGLDFGSADSEGTLNDGAVRWTLDLGATDTATLRTTMTVTATPPDLLRLATVACATVGGSTAPLVCASHSDLLPAGALVGSSTATAAQPDRSASHLYVLGSVVLVLAAALITLLIRRRPAALARGAST